MLEVFTSNTCAKCMLAKEYLKGRGIEFEEKDIAIDTNRLELMGLGIMELPTMRLNGVICVGFDPMKVERLITVAEGQV